MNGNEAAAFFDEAGEVFELLRRDCFVIGVEEDPVEFGEIVVITEGFFDIGMVVEVDGLAAQGFRKHGEVGVGVVVLLIVSEEENPEWAFFRGELFGGGLSKRQECDERER